LFSGLADRIDTRYDVVIGTSVVPVGQKAMMIDRAGCKNVR
jgi:hypothetical protein